MRRTLFTMGFVVLCLASLPACSSVDPQIEYFRAYQATVNQAAMDGKISEFAANRLIQSELELVKAQIRADAQSQAAAAAIMAQGLMNAGNSFKQMGQPNPSGTPLSSFSYDSPNDSYDPYAYPSTIDDFDNLSRGGPTPRWSPTYPQTYDDFYNRAGGGD